MRPLNRSGMGAGAPSSHFTILLHQTMGLPIALPEKPSAAFLMVTHLDDTWLFLPNLPIPDYIYQNLYSSEPLVAD